MNGKLYDTDTAKELVSADNGYPVNDFSYAKETLYLKRTGEYFLHGEGHGNSRYGEWHGNTGGWGEKIMPFTLDEAKEWSENNLDGDEYIEIFGNPEGLSDTKATLNLTVTENFKARMNKLKEETSRSISELIEDIVTKELDSKDKQKI